jgi:hypothetical protein
VEYGDARRLVAPLFCEDLSEIDASKYLQAFLMRRPKTMFTKVILFLRVCSSIMTLTAGNGAEATNIGSIVIANAW